MFANDECEVEYFVRKYEKMVDKLRILTDLGESTNKNALPTILSIKKDIERLRTYLESRNVV